MYVSGPLGLYMLGPFGLLCAWPTWLSVCLAHLAFCVLGPLGLYMSLVEIMSPVGLYLYLCLLWRLCPSVGIVSIFSVEILPVSSCGDCTYVSCENFTCVFYGDCAFVHVPCEDFNCVSLKRLYGLFGCMFVAYLVMCLWPSWLVFRLLRRFLYVCVYVFVYGLVGLCFYNMCWLSTEMCCESLVKLRVWGGVNIMLWSQFYFLDAVALAVVLSIEECWNDALHHWANWGHVTKGYITHRNICTS